MFLTIRKDTQKVSVSGIDQPEADVMQLTSEYLAIKVPGHSYSYGNMPSDRSYAPVEIQIWKIQEKKDLGKILQLTADRIMEFPVKKSKK